MGKSRWRLWFSILSKRWNNKCLLVKISPTLEIPGLFAYHDNTDRECANSDSYVVMLSAIADTRYTDFYFNGTVQPCGKGHPSKSHKNGNFIDMRYLWKDERVSPINITNENHWKEFDLDRHTTFMSKLSIRGFNEFLVQPVANYKKGEPLQEMNNYDSSQNEFT